MVEFRIVGFKMVKSIMIEFKQIQLFSKNRKTQKKCSFLCCLESYKKVEKRKNCAFF